MNQRFHDYAFGRAFNLHLSDLQIETLAAICRGEEIATYAFDGKGTGLWRRGLIDYEFDDSHHRRARATRAGMLVYDLLVEAGEQAVLEEKRRQAIEAEEELHRREWDERFGDIRIKLKDRHLRVPPALEESR